jgi:hypothetical protein
VIYMCDRRISSTVSSASDSAILWSFYNGAKTGWIGKV